MNTLLAVVMFCWEPWIPARDEYAFRGHLVHCIECPDTIVVERGEVINADPRCMHLENLKCETASEDTQWCWVREK